MSDEAEKDQRRKIEALLDLMAALRTPVTGCPWDLEQNFSTIAPYTLEEAYEVCDAIARGDLADLKEELGDLLLQVAFHSRMAEEEGAFAFPDVVEGIVTKMLRRHPHVFGDETARTSGLAKDAWERIKAEEKAEKAAERAALGLPPRTSGGVLGDVPVAMPSLVRAIKLQDKAARVGFDWPSLGPVLDKLKEEVVELEEALREGVRPGGSDTGDTVRNGVRSGGSGTPAAFDDRLAGNGPAPTARIEEELGDLLFVVANVARHLKLDPEAALSRANDKFVRRFAYIEAELARRGKTPSQSTLQEMDDIWNEVRARDKLG